LTQTGGSIAVTNNRMTIANGSANSVATYNMSGGTYSGSVYVGENGTGTLNVSGTALFNTALFGVALPAVYIGSNSGAVGTVNLNTGGTIATRWVGGGAGASTFNFDGGTLQATASDTVPNPAGQLFMTATLTGANVKAGGAKIDTNGFDVTIAQVLSHDAALGATLDGGLTKSSSRTLKLTGNNTYTGNTTVNGGILDVVNLNTPNATVTVAGGSNQLIATSLTANVLTVGAGATVTIRPIPGGPLGGAGSLTAVPEPSTCAMLVLAAMGLGLYWRRSR
jgi:autotransporter-associated beta strand protein